MSFREIIVISDVHLSVDRGGWFQADIPLKNFFQWVIEEAKGSHLVLNGDIFDFLANNSEPGSRGIWRVKQHHKLSAT
jgi:metallophosphoesterase superfamily enzyme